MGFVNGNKTYFDTISIKCSKDKISSIRKKSIKNKINFRYFSNEQLTISLDETTNLDDILLILSCFGSIKKIDLTLVDESISLEIQNIKNDQL